MRSPARALTALLRVNPRAAPIGSESGDNGAAARVLRQGVTVVGSRERRPICVPDALIIESPRVLVGGLEIASVSSAESDREHAYILRTAAGVSAAAGSPWGAIFGRVEGAEAVDGTFDGLVTSAEIDEERLRDGALATVDADELVPGDVIMLAPGDRVPADARLIAADELEVDLAALSGESWPVAKVADGGTDASRVVLEGSEERRWRDREEQAESDR